MKLSIQTIDKYKEQLHKSYRTACVIQETLKQTKAMENDEHEPVWRSVLRSELAQIADDMNAAVEIVLYNGVFKQSPDLQLQFYRAIQRPGKWLIERETAPRQDPTKPFCMRNPALYLLKELLTGQFYVENAEDFGLRGTWRLMRLSTNPVQPEQPQPGAPADHLLIQLLARKYGWDTCQQFGHGMALHRPNIQPPQLRTLPAAEIIAQAEKRMLAVADSVNFDPAPVKYERSGDCPEILYLNPRGQAIRFKMPEWKDVANYKDVMEKHFEDSILPLIGLRVVVL